MTRSTYVKVLDNLADHPRWLEVSPAGIGLWVLSLGYCSRNLTDGMFPAVLVRRWGVLEDVSAVDELLQGGRWHEGGHDCVECPEVPHGKLYVHAYLDHQRSAEQVAEISAKRAEAGRSGGAARVANQVAKQTSGKPKQTSSRSNPDTDTETEAKNTLPAAVAAEFDAWWSRYPRKTGKDAASKAYAKARKSATVEQLAHGLLNALAVWKAENTEGQFIPHPTTWLNQGRWQDEQTTIPATTEPQRVTLNQCDGTACTVGRHEWTNGRNRFSCSGLEA